MPVAWESDGLDQDRGAPVPPSPGEPATQPDSAAPPQAAAAAASTSVPSESAAPRTFSPTAGLVAVGAMIAAVMVLGLIVLALRKRLFRDEAEDRTGAGLMDELREALREGRMTQEEFDAARRVMVANIKRAMTTEKNERRKS